MTSLQETAMGGGPATAKVASYVLVAADAGTTVAMNAAGATTITVNTGLFAAGDTVFIQNLGAGACTVTAGTATVATAGSLILPQNDAGILYFTSASAAIFYDYIQVGAASPLTTKGDLYTFGTSDTRLGVGANGTTLVADSSEATGLKWAAAGGGMTLITTTTFNNTASTYTYSSLGSYKHLMIVIDDLSMAASTSIGNLVLQYNGVTTGAPYDSAARGGTGSYQEASGNASNYMYFGYRCIANSNAPANDRGYVSAWIYDYAGATEKVYSSTSRCSNTGGDSNYSFTGSGCWNDTAAITSLTLKVESASNFATGTLKLYGVS
jgi:hypothetical protein